MFPPDRLLCLLFHYSLQLLTTVWQQYKILKKILEDDYDMKVDRLVSIIMILLDKKRIGAQELADMFEVSPRTIYRDIDTINSKRNLAANIIGCS